MIKKFIKYNKQICEQIKNRYPYFASEEVGKEYKNILLKEINKFLYQRNNIKVLEIGGIDRPLIQKRNNIQYTGLDIEYTENCRQIYDKFIQQSIENPINEYFDLIFSMTLLEHVANNTESFRNIYAALKSGMTAHYLPSKNHPYSLILRIAGPRFQKRLIDIFRPWASDVTGYRAFFDKCSPKEMGNLLNEVGFINIEIIPFYRANDYFSFFVPLFLLVTLWENFCKKNNLRQFCSGFVMIASKD